jgi:hypothetical protein
MRKSKSSLTAAMAELREILSGPSLRAAAGIKDEGEIMTAVIGDDSTNVHDVHEKKRDVWTRFTDVLTGISYVGRLIAPAGILWRAPDKGDGALVIRGRKMNAPGAALVIPDGGDGRTDNVVPDWFPADAGIMEPAKILRLESAKDAVVIKSNTGDTVAIVSLNKDGSVRVEAAGGKDATVVAQNAFINAGQVHLGSGTALPAALNGVVLASGIDPFTGATYGALQNASSSVTAKK